MDVYEGDDEWGAFFGESVSLSADGNTAAVGAPGEDSNVNGDQSDSSAQFAGAVYLFTRSGNTWSQETYIKANNTHEFNYFVGSVSLSAVDYVPGHVIDHAHRRHAREVLERPAVVTQPGLDALIGHQLCVHVTAPCQHHHEEPRLLDFPRVLVHDLGALSKIHLRSITRREVEHRSEYRRGGLAASNAALYGSVSAEQL